MLTLRPPASWSAFRGWHEPRIRNGIDETQRLLVGYGRAVFERDVVDLGGFWKDHSTICFGLSGEIDLEWGTSPCISLDMEFHHMGVSAYFRLVLWSFQAGVEINYVTFKDSSPEPDENTLRLVNAIADARLVPAKRDQPAAGRRVSVALPASYRPAASSRPDPSVQPILGADELQLTGLHETSVGD